MGNNYISDLSYTHTINKVMHPHQHVFEMYSKDKTKKCGTLVCHKSEVPLRPNYKGSVLAIDFLEVSDKNKGVGTKILKFAKNCSEKMGCNGYMVLKSDSSYTPEKIPHLFYRKFGFSTFDKKTDKKLDKFINSKQNATSKDFPCLIMHYPPQVEKTNKGLEFLYDIFKKIFKKSVK